MSERKKGFSESFFGELEARRKRKEEEKRKRDMKLEQEAEEEDLMEDLDEYN